MTVSIKPLEYRAGCTTFAEWVTLFTLCLAPLIAHIISGTVPASHLAHGRPKWHDSICHYNPTSIVWRYAALVDRRLRAKNWSPNDLAASNAIFWTSRGWNGDESMVALATPYRVQCPESSHISIFSFTMLKTVIVTLQGVAALYSLTGSFKHADINNPAIAMGLDAIFFPLAILGLLRLCAAAWLAEDFSYMYTENVLQHSAKQNELLNEDGIPLIHTAEEYDPWLMTPPQSQGGFRTPNSSWISCVFRTFYLLLCFGVWIISFLSTIPLPGQQGVFSFTSFLVGIFYFVFLSVSNLTYVFYFLCGKTTTTIIPCISSTWYKVYTILLMAMILVLIIISAIETQRGPDGHYKSLTYPLALDCKAKSQWGIVSPSHNFSGVISSVTNSYDMAGSKIMGSPLFEAGNNTASSNESFWRFDFTGYCVGKLGGA
ncbi:hypothetical protein BDU57DRAFT_109803 [Ampelomyces quisqualis]|uniref:Uncharacterized protein n=1 Tax=Ampelomyces quisqualis TaxID=50730 RepID=A0A6A5Q6C6_AMPQU|nr:hypothetical protein BDU57DRAFT_109803 [Ampelomyces quisqualis]